MQMETSFPSPPITCYSQHFGSLCKKYTNDESTHQKDHIQILKTKSFWAEPFWECLWGDPMFFPKVSTSKKKKVKNAGSLEKIQNSSTQCEFIIYHSYGQKKSSPFHKSPKKAHIDRMWRHYNYNSFYHWNRRRRRSSPCSSRGVDWWEHETSSKFRSKCGESVGTWTRKSWAPSASTSTKLLTVTVWTVLVVSVHVTRHVTTWDEKGHTQENTSQEKRMKFGWNLDEIIKIWN
jgi:hypothetical protein